jgi:hypothetical protein
MAYAGALSRGDSGRGHYRNALRDIIAANKATSKSHSSWWRGIELATGLDDQFSSRTLAKILIDSFRDTGFILNLAIVFAIACFIVWSALQRMVRILHVHSGAYLRLFIVLVEWGVSECLGTLGYFVFLRDWKSSLIGGAAIGLCGFAIGITIRALIGWGNSSPWTQGGGHPNVAPAGTLVETRTVSLGG